MFRYGGDSVCIIWIVNESYSDRFVSTLEIISTVSDRTYTSVFLVKEFHCENLYLGGEDSD